MTVSVAPLSSKMRESGEKCPPLPGESCFEKKKRKYIQMCVCVALNTRANNTRGYQGGF